jgi:hypothetical protein
METMIQARRGTELSSLGMQLNFALLAKEGEKLSIFVPLMK